MLLETLLLNNLGLIERLARATARSLKHEARRDFVALVKLKLVENNYGVLAKFRGESKLSTYLKTVIERWFLSEYVRQHGRFRPTASAQRRGPLAVRLEILVRRDGYSLEEAVQILRGDPGVTESEAELRALGASLGSRPAIRIVASEGVRLEEQPSPSRAEVGVEREELRALACRVQAALAGELAQFEGRERLILRMRFADSFTAVDIARFFGLDQRRVYALLERLMARLAGALARAGIDRRQAAELLHGCELLAEEWLLVDALRVAEPTPQALGQAREKSDRRGRP